MIIEAEKKKLEKVFSELSPEEILALNYDWEGVWAREKQKLPAGDWTYWLILAGRGFGKTRTLSETIRIWKDQYPILMLAGPTAADVRDVMVEGDSGILAVSPPWDRPMYEPSKRRLTWKNGAVALLMSADEPDRFRGPQAYAAAADELAAWRYPESWDMMKLGVRLGKKPRIIITTTPRNTKVIRELKDDPGTVVTTGSTYENKNNLASSFFDAIVQKYEGTRLGQQEIYAEILDDVEGALWTQEMIEEARVKELPEMQRIVIAIDPAVTSNKSSDETGIVVCGLGIDGKGYIIDDLSGRYSPDAWARIAIKSFDKYKADRIIAEVNNGGDLVESVIRQYDETIPYKAVRASRGKVTRAEPVVALYEQGRVKHAGQLATLEDQMLTWSAQKGEKSPDRVDALVWGITELIINTRDDNVWI